MIAPDRYESIVGHGRPPDAEEVARKAAAAAMELAVRRGSACMYCGGDAPAIHLDVECLEELLLQALRAARR